MSEDGFKANEYAMQQERTGSQEQGDQKSRGSVEASDG